mgnify:CR=1 FL=1
MLNYIKSECYRVMHSRSTYVMTGIMAVLPVLFHIILYVTGVASSTTQDFPYDITSFFIQFSGRKSDAFYLCRADCCSSFV